jgi:hypothetical protein
MHRLLLLLLLTAPAAAADLASQAESLAKLRAEVETLGEELERAQVEQRNELRALAGQKAELAAQLRREELRLAQIGTRLDEAKAALAEQGTDAELQAAVLGAADTLGQGIAAGLPFRAEERAKAVGDLAEQVRSGLLKPERAVPRLWALVEDELRLAREVGLQRQAIPLDGLVSVYFVTADGRVGMARGTDGTWTWEVLTDRAAQAQVLELFDQLRKNVREGWFDLPGPLPMQGA